MRMRQKKLPVGIENFEDIRKEPFYYADKTGLLVELLDSWGAVNLFTRPRRFGKTLNMSMLEHFFSLHGDKSIFDGLQISKETELVTDIWENIRWFPFPSKGLKRFLMKKRFKWQS